MSILNFPKTGFQLWTSCIGSNCSTTWATATVHKSKISIHGFTVTMSLNLWVKWFTKCSVGRAVTSYTRGGRIMSSYCQFFVWRIYIVSAVLKRLKKKKRGWEWPIGTVNICECSSTILTKLTLFLQHHFVVHNFSFGQPPKRFTALISDSLSVHLVVVYF